jgi:hypothetical protein
MVSPSDICRLIGSTRCDLSTEKRTQADIQAALVAAAIPFEREKRLSDKDIPDFLVEGRIAVEVKLKGSPKMAIYQQLARYAEHAEAEALVLATNLSMGLPAEIGGKPAFYVSLGGAWL